MPLLFGKKRRCTELAEGRVVGFHSYGGDFATVIFVRYTVHGREFELKENARYKNEAIRAGKIPIGQRKAPVLGDISVGDAVAVMYNPKKPSDAYLRDNARHRSV